MAYNSFSVDFVGGPCGLVPGALATLLSVDVTGWCH